jgi:hypothetical protein
MARNALGDGLEGFDQVTDNLGHDPRTLKAVVRARDQLAAGLAKTLPASASP